MKIDTTKPLVTLSGKIIKDGLEEYTVGKAIANMLIDTEKGGKMKMFLLAKKFYSEKEVEVDIADIALIKAELENPKANTLISGQLLVMLEELRETETKDNKK